jgi:hypothetical protein
MFFINRIFLCLFSGGAVHQKMPKGLTGEEEVDNSKAKFENKR